MILVLRALGIGDLAASVPALRGLRSHTGERIVLAAPAWLAPLAELTGAVDEVHPVDGLAPHPWPFRPRLSVNLHGRGPESHRMLPDSPLWGFTCLEAGHLDGPAWHDDEHEVARWCRLLGHYGVRCDPGDLDLADPGGGVEGATVIHPGAKSPTRRWPASRFAEVAYALRARGHRVLITGDGEERELVAALSGATAVRTGLRELAGLVARARLVISGDTGVSHLATAYRRPSVTLFGPVPPARWGPPPGRGIHRALWHGTTAGRGDLPDGPADPALMKITVAEVLGAVSEAELRAATEVVAPR